MSITNRESIAYSLNCLQSPQYTNFTFSLNLHRLLPIFPQSIHMFQPFAPALLLNCPSSHGTYLVLPSPIALLFANNYSGQIAALLVYR